MRAAPPTIRQNDYTCECFPVKAATFKNTPMARIIKQGKCGDKLTWTINNEGVLTISGSGEMRDYWDSPFKNNTNIIKVEISQGVTSIGAYAFEGCEALTSIDVAESNANYASIDGVLYNKDKKILIQCPGGKNNIEIPNSVTEIGKHAFSGCNALTSIEIPDSVTTIGEFAFDGCEALTSIEIPNSVTSIGRHAFDGCKALTSIEIPDSVTEIGDDAFDGCSALTSINIPDSVTKIGDYAFSECEALTSVTIPNSVTEIGDDAFEGCEALEKVEFASIESLCSISFNGGYSNPLELAPHLYINGQEVTNLIIPNGVTRIGDGAFCGCEALTSIKIPDSVTTIGEEAFSYCTSLMSINVTEDKKILIQCPGGKNNIEIPNSVRIIGDYAFSGCEALTSITIPNSVTSIGEYAFYGCEALTSIEIPNSVTTIGENAFEGCNALKDLHIRCEHPEDLEIKTNAFGNTPIENCTLHVPAGTENAYRHHPVFGKFKEVVIEK